MLSYSKSKQVPIEPAQWEYCIVRINADGYSIFRGKLESKFLTDSIKYKKYFLTYSFPALEKLGKERWELVTTHKEVSEDTSIDHFLILKKKNLKSKKLEMDKRWK